MEVNEVYDFITISSHDRPEPETHFMAFAIKLHFFKEYNTLFQYLSDTKFIKNIKRNSNIHLNFFFFFWLSSIHTLFLCFSNSANHF